MGVKLHL